MFTLRLAELLHGLERVVDVQCVVRLQRSADKHAHVCDWRMWPVMQWRTVQSDTAVRIKWVQRVECVGQLLDDVWIRRVQSVADSAWMSGHHRTAQPNTRLRVGIVCQRDSNNACAVARFF